jgi:hypothetical protein
VSRRLELLNQAIGTQGIQAREQLQAMYPYRFEQIFEFERAYQDAFDHQEEFLVFMQGLQSVLSRVIVQNRPNKIKSRERALKKYLASEVVPTDFLAAKLITPNLKAMYQTAKQLPEHCTALYFEDRLVNPQSSGYADLQFHVRFKNQIAEIKITHWRIDQIDKYEHRLYEVVREFASDHAQDVLTKAEKILVDGLKELSPKVYAAVWAQILELEVV